MGTGKKYTGPNVHEERDIMMNMLNTMRDLKEGVLTENNQESDTIQLSGTELADEQQKFRETISPRVEFHAFNIYPQNNNVFFSGKFNDLGNAEWSFSLDESDGVYIDVDGLQLTDDALRTIQRLKGYYDAWADEWATKLATEYKSGNVQQSQGEIETQ